MKQITVDSLINDVLGKEGGYVHHPADKGGPTKYGITQATLGKWCGVPVTERDVRLLSEDHAREIYKSEYLEKPGIYRLPEILQPLVFDMAVNHGPGKAIKLLQEVVDRMSGKTIAHDGKIGKITVAACNIAVNVYGKEVVRQLILRRKDFYRSIVDSDPTQAVFLDGWLNRADSFLIGK